MGIIENQALDAILHQQFKQQIFAFAPASPRSQPQGGQQEVSQGRFFGIVFGGRHGQYRKAPPAHHPGFTLGGGAQIADTHGFAAAWLCHNHMPSPELPCLAQEPLEPLLKRRLDEALEERQSISLHASFSVLNGRMGKICAGYALSGSGLASGKRKLEGAGGWSVARVSRT